VDPADDAVGRVPQRRLDCDALLGRPHLARGAEATHPLRLRDRALERRLFGVECEDAARELVVLDASVAPQFAQRVQAVERQREDLAGVLAVAERQALEEEARAPGPLPPFSARAEDERRILVPEPLRKLRRHPRLGPRLGVAGRDLPAVGEAGLESGGALAVDDGDLVTLPRQVPRARGADDPRAEHDHPHAAPLANVMRTAYTQPGGCAAAARLQ
jgi:hypothetical protein